MTSKQQLKIKSSVVNTNNCLNGIFPAFDFLKVNFLLVLDWLILFQVDIPFIKQIVKIKRARPLSL